MANGINKDYFKVIDCQEKAYFIGFIAADGYIDKKQNKLTFNLNIKDREILEKFCQLTGCTNKISDRKIWDKRTKKYYFGVTLQVCCTKLIKNLSYYGLDNNKTKSYFIKNVPNIFIKDCIRGLIDGDGHIGKTHTSLITTLENISFITKFLKDIKVNDYKEEIKKENNVYKMFFYKDRFKLLDLIYTDSKIHLERKYISYKNTKIQFDNRTRIVYNTILQVFKNELLHKQFNSIIECSKELNIPQSTISNAIRDKKVTRGFTFVKINKVKKERKVNYESIL